MSQHHVVGSAAVGSLPENRSEYLASLAAGHVVSLYRFTFEFFLTVVLTRRNPSARLSRKCAIHCNGCRLTIESCICQTVYVRSSK